MRKVDVAPCGGPNFHSLVSSDYNTVVRKTDDVNEVIPVCSDEPAQIASAMLWGKTELRNLRVTQVLQILSCTRDEKVPVRLRSGEPADGSGGDKAPQRIDPSITKRWTEDFQLRAFLMAKTAADPVEGAVKLSLWNQRAPEGPNALLGELAKFSVAQAEYFYDSNDSIQEWMWNMRWKARLRRFRMPEETSKHFTEGLSATLGGSRDLFLLQLDYMKDSIAH